MHEAITDEYEFRGAGGLVRRWSSIRMYSMRELLHGLARDTCGWMTRRSPRWRQHLDRPIGEIRLLHTRPARGRVSLREHANGDCIYFDPEQRRCTVYEVRPKQCRSWPFWKSNLASPEAWKQVQQGVSRGGAGRSSSVSSKSWRQAAGPDRICEDDGSWSERDQYAGLRRLANSGTLP